MTFARGFRDLIVWQRSMDLADGVYDLAETFRHPRTFALADQMRRAAVSIPSNIAEGHGRRSRGDYIRFVSIANGSLRELETQLLFAERRGFAEASVLVPVFGLADEVGRLLTGLYRKLVTMPRTR